MEKSIKRILVVFHNSTPDEKTRITILQHLQVFEYSEFKHHLVYYNTYEATPRGVIDTAHVSIPSNLKNMVFDAIILHYTFLNQCTLGFSFYKWRRKFDWIRELNCLKIAMPQDEGDFIELLDEWLFDLGVSVIFSIHYRKGGPLYPIMSEHSSIYPCLPGYIDDKTANRLKRTLLPICERQKDIVYRARQLPYRFGKAGRMKYMVADMVAPRAISRGFNVDISTRYEDAIYGDTWFDFLSSAKAVIGTPGGWSAIDWRGELRANTNRMLRKNPSLRFEEFNKQMSKGWDDYQFFTVTPRHFEAVITKTCQVLVEGDYKGILEADRHYLPIKQDFSNLDDVLEKLQDVNYLQELADRAYKDIFLTGQYSYRSFAKKIDIILNKHLNSEKEVGVSMTDSKSANKAIAALERQLIAERHQNALIHASIPDLADQMTEKIVSALAKRVKAQIKRLLPVLGGFALAVAIGLVLVFTR